MKWCGALLVGLLLISGSVSAQLVMPEYRPLWQLERNAQAPGRDHSEDFAFSPDGTQIAASESDSSINIWDVATGQVVRTLSHDPPAAAYASLMAVTWSPDGAWIGGGTYAGVFRLWNAATGELEYERLTTGYHHSWSPDSTQIATDAMYIVDAQSGMLAIELGENWSVPYHSIWSPDGRLIATPGNEEGDTMNLWTAAGERFDTYRAGTSAAWSPDSTRIATSGQIRDVESGLLVVLIAEMDGVLAWHPNGNLIASTRNLRARTVDTIYLWDTETGELVTSWTLEGCIVDGITWSPDGEHVAMNCVNYPVPNQNTYVNWLVMWERVP